MCVAKAVCDFIFLFHTFFDTLFSMKMCVCFVCGLVLNLVCVCVCTPNVVNAHLFIEELCKTEYNCRKKAAACGKSQCVIGVGSPQGP